MRLEEESVFLHSFLVFPGERREASGDVIDLNRLDEFKVVVSFCVKSTSLFLSSMEQLLCRVAMKE